MAMRVLGALFCAGDAVNGFVQGNFVAGGFFALDALVILVIGGQRSAGDLSALTIRPTPTEYPSASGSTAWPLPWQPSRSSCPWRRQ